MTTFIDPDGGDTLDYTYDAAGNEISKNNTSTSVSWTYGYNNSNQLVSVTETNTATSETMETVSYEYDALGNLLKETVTAYSMGLPSSTTNTEFAVDGWNPAKAGGMGNSAFDTWAVMNGSGALQTRNIQGNGIDQILARVDNYSNGASDPTGLYFDLTDRLGSVRDVLNNTPDASPVAVMTYDAWGNLISTPSSYQGMYGWDGYQIDEATSLYLDHARVYDPQSQRWIEQDPTWFDAGDSNLYRYVNNGPTNATDPSGMQDAPPRPAVAKGYKHVTMNMTFQQAVEYDWDSVFGNPATKGNSSGNLAGVAKEGGEAPGPVFKEWNLTYTKTSYGVTFRVLLKNFTEQQGYDVVRNIAAVRFAIGNALKSLSAYDLKGEAGDTSRAQVNRWFAVKGTNLTEPQLKKIVGVYQAIANGIDNQVIEIVNKPDLDGTYGQIEWTKTDGKWVGVFAVGKLYFSSDRPKDKFGTIIHEFAHLYGDCRGDPGFFVNPDSLDEANDVTYKNAEGKAVTLSVDQKLNNADTYAGYLTQYFFPRK